MGDVNSRARVTHEITNIGPPRTMLISHYMKLTQFLKPYNEILSGKKPLKTNQDPLQIKAMYSIWIIIPYLCVQIIKVFAFIIIKSFQLVADENRNTF